MGTACSTVHGINNISPKCISLITQWLFYHSVELTIIAAWRWANRTTREQNVPLSNRLYGPKDTNKQGMFLVFGSCALQTSTRPVSGGFGGSSKLSIPPSRLPNQTSSPFPHGFIWRYQSENRHFHYYMTCWEEPRIAYSFVFVWTRLQRQMWRVICTVSTLRVGHWLSATFPAIVCCFTFIIIESHPTGTCRDGKNSRGMKHCLIPAGYPHSYIFN